MPLPRPLAFAFIAILAACDGDPPELTPPGSPEDFLRAADILVAAQCELDAAAARADPGFIARKADITLSLLVRVSESTGGGITLTIPIASTDLTLRRDRVPEGTAIRRMDFRIIHTLGDTLACPSADAPLTATGLRFIEGGLGLAEWVTETDRLVAHAGHAPSEVNYAMSFDVTLSDDRSPVFSRPTDSIETDFTRQDASAREVRHRIAVTIVPGQPFDGALHDAATRFLDRIGG
ncbi:hypothetical protein EF888_07180 [Silicimonas algicola]|uniref:Lipoprotein n=1 Tax=Silicimonas algicola TaxID=1826607 RepID=A0A316G3D6_9RHOB|nr:hypothetical protein [Silicimonas algicola]AZQ66941.1 hypothetical protein EF888_07180 [Silicimonas algicola]PWK55143.1 hypothetical protein C8D95_10818 [Silicimonas algicola]